MCIRDSLSRITPVRGTLLADRIQHLCMELVSHIAATSYLHQKITRMLLNFKTDVEDNVWFLWCASVRVAPSDGDDDGASLGATPLKRSVSHDTFKRSPLGGHDAAQGARHPDLAPVCLNPAMSTPSRPPLPKGARPVESVCPFTSRPLGDTTPFFLTYKNIVEYQAVLDARSRVRRPPTEVPPLLLRVCPELDGHRYAKEVANPLSLFLFTRVLVSEEAYLDFSTTMLPGAKVLPAITGRAVSRAARAPHAQVLRSRLGPAASPIIGVVCRVRGGSVVRWYGERAARPRREIEMWLRQDRLRACRYKPCPCDGESMIIFEKTHAAV